jgi:hypothetical protein
MSCESQAACAKTGFWPAGWLRLTSQESPQEAQWKHRISLKSAFIMLMMAALVKAETR